MLSRKELFGLLALLLTSTVCTGKLCFGKFNKGKLEIQGECEQGDDIFRELEAKVFAQRRAATYSSCAEANSYSTNGDGLYTISDGKGSSFSAYCDMTTAGGGWTLVASVHENDMAGRCTQGDRWSSEKGNSASNPHGDGAWENTVLFGSASTAASDDYKNRGYHILNASDIMLWHVPNKTPLKDYKTKAWLMYHTSSQFLRKYGDNLYNFFRNFYPIRGLQYSHTNGQGPAEPIIWDKGNNSVLEANSAPNALAETDSGFIQFRAINHEQGAFAMCPGFKIKHGYGHVEHECIGSTGYDPYAYYCGDFAAKDYSGYGTGRDWSSSKLMTESVVMIFYR